MLGVNMQTDTGSSCSHDTEEHRDCPHATHELAHPCTSEWLANPRCILVTSSICRDADISHMKQTSRCKVPHMTHWYRRQGFTSAGYKGIQDLRITPCDKIPVDAQASIAAAVSEVLARRTTDGVLPNGAQLTAAEALLKAAEENAALPAPLDSGQPRRNTDNAQRLPETLEVDLIGAAYEATSYLNLQLPSSGAAAADQPNVDSSLAKDFAFLGIDPNDAHAASLLTPGNMGRPNLATSNDSTAAALHVAGHELGKVGNATWHEVLLSEQLNKTTTSYKLEQLLQQPDRQHDSAEANYGYACHELGTSPIPAGTKCGHERPPSRLGSAQRVPHQRAMAQWQRKGRSTAVQLLGTRCGARECHGWDSSPRLRQAPPRPCSHGWWRGEGLSGSPHKETALDWLHAQAATLHDAWPASGSSCPAPCSRPQTAVPQQSRVATPEEVPAAGPLIRDGTSSCGGLLAGRLSGLGSAPQPQCFNASYQPLSASNGARGWGGCGLYSRTGSSPRPGCAPRRSALSAHKGLPCTLSAIGCNLMHWIFYVLCVSACWPSCSQAQSGINAAAHCDCHSHARMAVCIYLLLDHSCCGHARRSSSSNRQGGAAPTHARGMGPRPLLVQWGSRRQCSWCAGLGISIDDVSVYSQFCQRG